ncbi:hypothetical protein LTR53_018656, partial [Teratosphaeriaceae sp. CCFEE 6253]
MYVSSAPCGDASMELTMRSQSDATPWPVPAVTATTDEISDRNDDLPGRADFARLGIVRRKPSRADAPSTRSKSCSDKLALKQCTSLLSGVVSLLIHPTEVYLSTLVLPEREYVEEAVERAFGEGGRMGHVREVAGAWGGG